MITGAVRPASTIRELRITAVVRADSFNFGPGELVRQMLVTFADERETGVEVSIDSDVRRGEHLRDQADRFIDAVLKMVRGNWYTARACTRPAARAGRSR